MSPIHNLALPVSCLAFVMSLPTRALCHSLRHAAASAMSLPSPYNYLYLDTVLTMTMPFLVPCYLPCHGRADVMLVCFHAFVIDCTHTHMGAMLLASPFCSQGCLANTPAPWSSSVACYLIATTTSHCLS